MRSDRKDARLSFTSLTQKEKESDGEVLQQTTCEIQVYMFSILFNTPDLVDDIHPRLLQEGFGDKAFGYDHLG